MKVNLLFTGNIAEIDFDLISHKFNAIKPIESIEGVRMMSLEDISAMKINAIVNSGERVKDYIDIFYLLKDMSLDHIFGYYCEKYPNVNADMARSSLLYHKDIDFSVPVKLYDKDLKWKCVTNGISQAVRTYDNLQESRKLYWKMQEIKKKDKGKDRGLSM